MTEVIVTAEYKGGLSASKDKELMRRAKRSCDGTGYCFIDGVRDLSWTYANVKNAEVAADRMRKIKGVHVRVHAS